MARPSRSRHGFSPLEPPSASLSAEGAGAGGEIEITGVLGGATGDRKEPLTGAQRIKLLLAVASILAGILFLALLILRLEADSRGANGPVGLAATWSEVFWPLGVSVLFSGMWAFVNYYSHVPLTGAEVGGHGGQYYQNLLHQTLVTRLVASSVDNLNEARRLRDVLQTLSYALLIWYSFMASHMSCTGCEVPYQMLAVGFFVTYGVRAAVSVYNGMHEYSTLRLLAREARAYQESLGETRLFHNAVPDLHKGKQLRFSVLLDIVLWMVAVTFGAMGTVWVATDRCDASCPATFHVYEFLIIGFYCVELASLLAAMLLAYYRRTGHVETVELLVDRIHEVQAEAARRAKRLK